MFGKDNSKSKTVFEVNNLNYTQQKLPYLPEVIALTSAP